MDIGYCYVFATEYFAIGGSKGALPACDPPPYMDQNFLNFMEFFGNLVKIICWRPHPLEG